MRTEQVAGHGRPPAERAIARVDRHGALATATFPSTDAEPTAGVLALLTQALPAIARDANVYALVLRCEPGLERATAGRRLDLETDRAMLADRHRLDWLLECFPKPTVALLTDAGAIVGLSLYCTHRVAAQGYGFSLPQTAIGLCPGGGSAWTLARLPGSAGVYLGLTGHAIGPADACALGLATHCIGQDRFDEILAALGDAEPVDPLLDSRHTAPGEGALAPVAAEIEHCFSAATVEAIVERLERLRTSTRPGVAAWAAASLASLAAASPLALKVALRHIRAAADLDLRQTIAIDYRLAWRLGELRPRGPTAHPVGRSEAFPAEWSPNRLADVSSAMVERIFAPLGADELVLATWQEMRAARL